MGALSNDTIDKVLRALDIRGVLEFLDYRGDTIQESDKATRCFCPVHHERVFRTLAIDHRTKKAKCSYNPCAASRGVDLIDLVALSHKWTREEAVAALAEHFRLKVDVPGAEQIVQQRLERARGFMSQGDLEGAYENFHRVVETDPRNAEALKAMLEIGRRQRRTDLIADFSLRLGTLCAEEHRFEEALGFLRSYIEVKPDDTEGRLRYVNCLDELGRKDDVLAELKQIAANYEAHNDLDRAVAIHQKIEAIDPRATSVEGMARMLVASGRIGEAVERLAAHARQLLDNKQPELALASYQRIFSLAPENIDVRQQYFQVAIGLRHMDDAVLQECLGIADHFVRRDAVLRAMKILSELRGRFPDREPILAKIYELYRQQSLDAEADEMAFDLAKLHHESGDYDSALRWVEQLVERGQNIEIALSMKARVCRDMGNRADAVDALIHIIDFNEKQGRYLEALPFYDSVIEIDPDNLIHQRRRLQALAELDRAEEMVSTGETILPGVAASSQTEEALAIVDMLVGHASLHADFLMARATILGKLGREPEASETLIRSAHVLADQKEFDKAAEILEHLVESDPANMLAVEALADVHMKSGRTAEALESYKSLAALHGEQGELDTQLEILLKVSRHDPTDMEVMHRILSLYEMLHNPQEAREMRHRIIHAHMEREQYGPALEMCRSIRQAEPGDIFALEASVRIHVSTGDKESLRQDALEMLDVCQESADHEHADQVLGLLETQFPDDAAIMGRRIMALCDLSEWDDAFALYDRLVAINDAAGRPGDSLALARQLVKWAELPVARLLPCWIDLCRKTADIQAHWKETEFLIGRLQDQAQTALVIEALRELEDEFPDFDPLRARHVEILRESGLSRKALEALQEWARVCVARGDFEEAAEHYDEALQDQPDDIDFLTEVLEFRAGAGMSDGAANLSLHLADLLETQGLAAQAIDMLDLALKLEPKRNELRERLLSLEELAASPEHLRERYMDVFRKHVSAGELDTARSVITEAVSKFPMDLDLRAQLAQLLESMNLTDEMVAEYANIASIQIETGDYVGGLNAVSEILRVSPDNPQAQEIQAEVKKRMGDEQKAFEEFRRFARSGGRSVAESVPGPIGAPSSEWSSQRLEMLPILAEYSFEHFIVSDRNNFAYATALAIARNPGGEYNPLFLYGDVGLGKTHLLQAIANDLVKTNPDLRVLYTSSEEFTNALIESIQHNSVKEFRALHKSPDVLLIDDVHFLAGKERAQEEFFLIFNGLYQAHRQIVLTSDRPPKDLAHLERRLRSRFGAGIIVDIQPPDFETRVAILRRETADLGVELDDAILSEIAQGVETNVRELKSALRQVLARVQIGKEKPSPDMAREVVEQILGHATA